jgi:GTP-binding protein
VDAIAADLQGRGYTVYRISAVTRAGLQPLIYDVMTRLEALRAEDRTQAESGAGTVHIVAPVEEDDRRWEARQVDATTFAVAGRGIERLVAMTDLENDYALRRLQRSLDKIGVTRKLKALGAKDGDTVRIRDIEFEYEDEDKWDEENGPEAPRRGGRASRA